MRVSPAAPQTVVAALTRNLKEKKMLKKGKRKEEGTRPVRAVLTVKVREDRAEKTRSSAIENTFQFLSLSIDETNMHPHSQSRTDDEKKVRGHHIKKKTCKMRAER